MKVNLKDNIWIEGFDNISTWNTKLCYFGQVSEKQIEVIWRGKTSEIPEEIAKESIQSACDKHYCIIYKNK